MDLKKVLRSLGLNQSTLAKQLGVNPSQVSLWANEVIRVPTKHQDKINSLVMEKIRGGK